jgi:hypothetical protein
MGTSKEEIRVWFRRGVDMGVTHMLVVCDTFDYEDYPVYVKAGESLSDAEKKYDGSNMQRIMEIYRMDLPESDQIDGSRRVFNR